MCNSINALTCYSSGQGTGALGGQVTCTTSTPFCYVNLNYTLSIFLFNSFNSFILKKATSAIGVTQFPQTAAGGANIGLLQPTSGLVSGDRGCLPAVGANTPQTTSAQFLLAAGAGVTGAGMGADFASMTSLLCSTSGVCCTTNLCNTMSRIEMSFVSLIMSIVLALFGVYNGF
jgi:hypothetical protein